MSDNTIEPNIRPRTAFVNLLKELPTTDVVWQTMSKNYTVAEMMLLIEEGDPVGLQWVSDVLRVSRDLVIRQHAKLNRRY